MSLSNKLLFRVETARQVPELKNWSLVSRLNKSFVITLVIVVTLASALMDWALRIGLTNLDNQILLRRMNTIEILLIRHPVGNYLISHEVNEDKEGPRHLFVRITNLSGKVLNQTKKMPADLTQSHFYDPMDSICDMNNSATIQTPSGTPFRTLTCKFNTTSDGTPLIVQMAIDISKDYELLSWYQRVLASVLALSVLISAVIGWQIVRRALAPMGRTADEVSEIGSKTLDYRLKVEGLPEELKQIASAFNAMLERVEVSYIRLHAFSDNLAHELRTPVNNMRLAIDVGLMNERGVEEYKSVLTSNAEDCQQLSRIIDDLLFLAQAEHNQIVRERENVNVARELRTIADFYSEAALDNGVQFSIECDATTQANLSRNMFQRAIGNLVVNALAHTQSGDRITIAALHSGKDLTVEIADTGEGIAEEHIDHIFDRFYRADKIRGQKTNRVGLGLAIVKSIVELHHGSVAMKSQPGEGARITLTFPANAPKPSII